MDPPTTGAGMKKPAAKGELTTQQLAAESKGAVRPPSTASSTIGSTTSTSPRGLSNHHHHHPPLDPARWGAMEGDEDDSSSPSASSLSSSASPSEPEREKEGEDTDTPLQEKQREGSPAGKLAPHQGHRVHTASASTQHDAYNYAAWYLESQRDKDVEEEDELELSAADDDEFVAAVFAANSQLPAPPTASTATTRTGSLEGAELEDEEAASTATGSYSQPSQEHDQDYVDEPEDEDDGSNNKCVHDAAEVSPLTTPETSPQKGALARRTTEAAEPNDYLTPARASSDICRATGGSLSPEPSEGQQALNGYSRSQSYSTYPSGAPAPDQALHISPSPPRSAANTVSIATSTTLDGMESTPPPNFQLFSTLTPLKRGYSSRQGSAGLPLSASPSPQSGSNAAGMSPSSSAPQLDHHKLQVGTAGSGSRQHASSTSSLDRLKGTSDSAEREPSAEATSDSLVTAHKQLELNSEEKAGGTEPTIASEVVEPCPSEDVERASAEQVEQSERVDSSGSAIGATSESRPAPEEKQEKEDTSIETAAVEVAQNASLDDTAPAPAIDALQSTEASPSVAPNVPKDHSRKQHHQQHPQLMTPPLGPAGEEAPAPPYPAKQRQSRPTQALDTHRSFMRLPDHIYEGFSGELCRFVDTFLGLSPPQRQERERFVNSVTAVILAVLEPAEEDQSVKVEVHGSMASGLSLVSSDIDFQVKYYKEAPRVSLDKVGASFAAASTAIPVALPSLSEVAAGEGQSTSATPSSEGEGSLASSGAPAAPTATPATMSVLGGISVPRSSGSGPMFIPYKAPPVPDEGMATGELYDVAVIPYTRVPVVKIVDRMTQLRADISFGGGDSEASMDLIEELLRRPHSRHMLLILKYLVKECRIGETERGGVTSFVLALLLLHFYEHRPSLPADDVVVPGKQATSTGTSADARTESTPSTTPVVTEELEVGSRSSSEKEEKDQEPQHLPCEEAIATGNLSSDLKMGVSVGSTEEKTVPVEGDKPTATDEPPPAAKLEEKVFSITDSVAPQDTSTGIEKTSDSAEKDSVSIEKKEDVGGAPVEEGGPKPQTAPPPVYTPPQHHPSPTLGRLLVEFLSYYSQVFEYNEWAIQFQADYSSLILPKTENARERTQHLQLFSPFGHGYDLTARMTLTRDLQIVFWHCLSSITVDVSVNALLAVVAAFGGVVPNTSFILLQQQQHHMFKQWQHQQRHQFAVAAAAAGGQHPQHGAGGAAMMPQRRPMGRGRGGPRTTSASSGGSVTRHHHHPLTHQHQQHSTHHPHMSPTVPQPNPHGMHTPLGYAYHASPGHPHAHQAYFDPGPPNIVLAGSPASVPPGGAAGAGRGTPTGGMGPHPHPTAGSYADVVPEAADGASGPAASMYPPLQTHGGTHHHHHHHHGHHGYHQHRHSQHVPMYHDPQVKGAGGGSQSSATSTPGVAASPSSSGSGGTASYYSVATGAPGGAQVPPSSSSAHQRQNFTPGRASASSSSSAHTGTTTSTPGAASGSGTPGGGGPTNRYVTGQPVEENSLWSRMQPQQQATTTTASTSKPGGSRGSKGGGTSSAASESTAATGGGGGGGQRKGNGHKGKGRGSRVKSSGNEGSSGSGGAVESKKGQRGNKEKDGGGRNGQSAPAATPSSASERDL